MRCKVVQFCGSQIGGAKMPTKARSQIFAVLVLFGIFMLTLGGCNSNSTSTSDNVSTRNGSLIDGNQPMPVVATEGIDAEGGEMILWGSGGASRLINMMNSEPMKTHITQMEAQGFRLSYENCCIVEGQAYPPDGDTLVSVEIYAISMELPGDSSLAALITRASNPNLGWVVQTQLLSSTAREAYEYSNMGDYGLWWKIYLPDYSMNLYPSYPRASKESSFDWKAWLKCVAEYAIVGCGSSAYGCKAMPVAFVPCVVIGCGSTIVFSMAACALHQIW
jgi:hypothetical protein